MRFLFVLSFFLILGTLGLAYLAEGQFEKVSQVRSENDALRVAIQQLEVETAELSGERFSDPIQVKFAADALADFYMRLMEAGEVLGAGVRITSRSGGGVAQFAPVKYGVLVAPVTMEAAADSAAAPALFAMLEDELNALPVSVRKLTARPQSGVITIQLDVDIFGR